MQTYEVVELINYQQLSLFKRSPPSFFYNFRFLVWYFTGRLLLASKFPGTYWRKQLLRLFGARIGLGGRIKPRLFVTCPWNLKVGNHCWIGESAWIDNLAPVVIGDNVCLSQGVYLCTGNHDYRSISFDLHLAPIRIDSSAWVAAKSVIAPGTTIGQHAVISLGSVVAGDIPRLSIVKGNPGIVVGQR